MRALLWIAGAALLGGCAGTRYADGPEKNLVVHAQLSGAEAVVGVHAVDAQCKASYEGYVPLDQPVTRVGLPPGRLSYLVFEFTHSSFWGGRSGSTRQETLLRPRPGAAYDARVTYKDGLYEVVIRERAARDRGWRELPLLPLGACRKAG